ncbi:MAG: putative ribose-5-phosphate isomerase B [Candidatus Parcubacteria bacterium]|nr:MAG: putative ribose-5-phosphate isomerase B [Candidatus Parcubacteria bacterium]
MIYLASDHRGFKLKEIIKNKLIKNKFKFIDLGYYNYNPNDDYPIIAFQLAKNIKVSKKNKGIIFCGSGIGVCIAVNRFKGIRAGSSDNYKIIKKGREDDDINILCLPSDFIDNKKAWLLIKIFLKTKFKNKQRYIRRIKQLDNYDKY